MAQYLHLVGPAVLLSVSVPLAVFAFFTTILAFGALAIRASIVYAELGFAIFHSWLFTATSDERNHSLKPPVGALQPSSRLSLRPQLQGSHAAIQNAPPADNPTSASRPALPTSESFTSLLGAGAPNRDFEGVGGWRLSKDSEDDVAWSSFNTRLQLPTVTGERQRKHKRSLTSQSQRFARSPEAFRMSPVDSRNRTPPAAAAQEYGQPTDYFDIPGQLAPISPEEVATKARMDERRLSVSSSNTSSAIDLKVLSSSITPIQPP